MGNAAIFRFTGGLVKSWDKRRAACFSRLVAALMRGGRLGVAALGRHVPTSAADKHRIKSVDRFLGNDALDLSDLWMALLALATSAGPRVFVLLDWTDLGDGFETLVAAVPYGGRAVPVAWASAKKGQYLRSRNAMESTLCRVIKALLPPTVELVIVADRGFGRASFFRALTRAGIHFIIRIRRDVHLIDERGHGPVSQRRIRRGKTRDLPHARYGDDARVALRCVITFGDGDGTKRPKSPWYLATDLSPTELPAVHVVAAYKRRMRIEQNFRDHKSRRFGFQMRSVRLTKVERWDRLLAIAAVAILLLIHLGTLAEHRGLHRQFKANTTTDRTHSRFQLGLAYVHRSLAAKPALGLLLAAFEAT